MAEYRLHCFAQSGNAYRVALFLSYVGADWEPVRVDFFNGATRTEEFRRLNVMGEVPVLEHRGEVICQSAVILDYLAAVFDQFDPGPQNAREALRWIVWDNQKLSGMLGPWRFMTSFLPEEKRDRGAIAFVEGRARGALDVLERHLSDREWIACEWMTTADLSCAGYLFYDGEYPFDIPTDYPAIERWRARLRAEPGWAHPYDLMPGHPLPGAR